MTGEQADGSDDLPPQVRRHRLRVVVSDHERAAIMERAAASNLPVSVYLRSLGTGYEPPSTLDLLAIRDLIRINADLGRLGGLLKLWLSERPGEGASTVDVRRLLRQIEAHQMQLKGIIKGLK
jgi:hypothetical protein